MKTRCVVVIGHVDHGKTTLVRALTGTETDRLPEEKARGMSIATGFAYRTYLNGIIDFIDAPGHEDFIQAMVGGASGARAALIVVSAVDGVAAQTSEHLDIAALLGIRWAIVAVTKADLSAAEMQAAQLDTIRATLARTPFAKAPLILCSAQNGTGLDEIDDALSHLLEQDPPQSPPRASYLPIDRVFTLPGRGTIVSGTLLGRALTLTEPLVIMPSGQEVTLRGLQSRGEDRTQCAVGERMAANLRGVPASVVQRGDVLCAREAFAASTCLDVEVTLLPNAPAPLRHMQEVRVLCGTSSAVAQVRLFGGGGLEQSKTGLAQLRFRMPLTSHTGQRAILRSLSPPATLGGAVVLDPSAVPAGTGDKGRVEVLRAAAKGNVPAIADALCAQQGGLAGLEDISRLSNQNPEGLAEALSDGFAPLDDAHVAPARRIEACKTDLLTRLEAYHAKHPLQAFAPRQDVVPPKTHPMLLGHAEALLLTEGLIRHKGTTLAATSHDPMALLTTTQHQRIENIEQQYRVSGLAPPPRKEIAQTPTDAALLDLLCDTERLISLQNIALRRTLFLHADTLTEAASTQRARFPHPASFTTGDARAALGTSRRIIVPVLEHFDALGITLRSGDTRQMRA